jgi:hypothetical protein
MRKTWRLKEQGAEFSISLKYEKESDKRTYIREEGIVVTGRMPAVKRGTGEEEARIALW